MNDDVLDIEDGNPFIDYFFLAEHQLTDVIDMLKENEIPYQIKLLSYTQDTLIVPTASEIALKRNSHIVQIPALFAQKVAYLLPEYPTLKEDSGLVRKLFLSTSMDHDGLLDIVLFPEEWQHQDLKFAKEILYDQGIDLSAHSLALHQQKRNKERSTLAQRKKIKQSILLFFVLLFLLAVLLSRELY